MIDIIKYCNYLYNSLYIPIYLYTNNTLTVGYPNDGTNICPPSIYLQKLCESENAVTYVTTKFHSYFGCIKVANSNSYIAIGPISSIPYSKEILLSMRSEFSTEELKEEFFFNFFYNIPTQTIYTFINTLLLINYTVNNMELSLNDVVHHADLQLYTTINQKFSNDSYLLKEEGIQNNNNAIEREFYRYVETGNIEGLKKFTTKAQSAKISTLADNNLRHLKNLFIASVTLATRAALKGGLTPSVANQLSELYINQVERLADTDAVTSLLEYAINDFTNRTANSILPPNSDNILHEVVKYVHENTNKNITVAEIASHVGFNRSYLSRKVKKELGFDLSSFIRKCKLEESKNLLEFSDKSISEISNFLCFSSQSHFQKAFKNQFGITPQAYRKSL